MTGLATFFEFDKTQYVNGQSRVLASKLQNGTLTDVAVPTSPASIFANITPYAPVVASGVSPWFDLGSTSGPIEDSRDVSLNEWKIQQQLVAVLMVPNEVVHTLKVPAMEVARAEILGLFENGPAEGSVAGATGHSAFVTQPFGQFTDLNQYRVAVASFMPLEAGVVTESGGQTRPRLFVKVFNRMSISAENVPLQWEIGQPLHADVTLKSYVEPSQTQNAEYGCYYIEAAGTIT